MISKYLSSCYCVAILTLLVLSGTLVSSQKVITSHSGREVPAHIIQKHFKKHLAASDFKKNIIYELTDGNIIQGPDLHIDLQSDVQPGHVTHLSKPAVTLNGNVKETHSMRLRTLRAKSYNIIVDDESGNILSVTGNGIILMPIGEAEYSGIFLNKMAFTKHEIELSTDSQIPSHGEDLRNSSRNIVMHEQNSAFQGSMSSLDFETGISTRQTSGSCRSGTTHYLEIAVAYDNTFCSLFNNVESIATETVQNVVDDSNGAYARNTCILLALVHIEAHCNDGNDPYAGFTGFNYRQILEGFRLFWIESRGDVHRDAAYLMTGFEEEESILGEAFIGAACDPQWGYGWTEGASTIVFAHEVGHTLGADHTGGGIMQGTLFPSTPLRFTRPSVAEFRNFIDSSGSSSCISTTRPSGLPEGPPATDGTCASGFSRTRALSCRNRRLRAQRVSLGGSRGMLSINLQQRNGQFIVRYRVTGRFFIRRYRDLVTTNEALVGGGLGRFQNVAGIATTVVSARDAGTLPRPTGEGTCCGQNLFVVSNVTVCVNSGGRRLCRTLRTSLRDTVVCADICFPNTVGVFTPMSADQACPSCV